jgi:hypothetical protein
MATLPEEVANVPLFVAAPELAISHKESADTTYRRLLYLIAPRIGPRVVTAKADRPGVGSNEI